MFNGYIGGLIINIADIGETTWKYLDYRTAGTEDEKREFLESKIKYQSIPLGLGNGFYVAMVSSISDRKQQFAEFFIDQLLSPSSIHDYGVEGEFIFSARKDFNKFENDIVLTKINKAITHTSFVNFANLPDFMSSEWQKVKNHFDENMTPASIVNAFRDALIARDEIDYLYDPISGDAYPSS